MRPGSPHPPPPTLHPPAPSLACTSGWWWQLPCRSGQSLVLLDTCQWPSVETAALGLPACQLQKLTAQLEAEGFGVHCIQFFKLNFHLGRNDNWFFTYGSDTVFLLKSKVYFYLLKVNGLSKTHHLLPILPSGRGPWYLPKQANGLDPTKVYTKCLQQLCSGQPRRASDGGALSRQMDRCAVFHTNMRESRGEPKKPGPKGSGSETVQIAKP